MACYHPLKAYTIPDPTNGKRQVIFTIKGCGSAVPIPINLPCQQCIGCRIDKSREWSLRCLHEKSMYQDNCFLTLTYNTENIQNGSLVKSDFQKFMKRLRKREKGKTIRYFHCGEYGEKLTRPHHHACIFNHDFTDKKVWTKREGVTLYRSKILEKLWPFGYSTIGEVTEESAAYVARYVIKKINGNQAKSHYRKIDKSTGEITQLQPEYITMSRRPGLGQNWLKKYTSDVYPKDFVTHKGKKFKPPKYYDKLYEVIEPDKLEKIKQIRVDKMAKQKHNNTKARLKVREQCQKASMKPLIRSFENAATNVLDLRQKE